MKSLIIPIAIAATIFVCGVRSYHDDLLPHDEVSVEQASEAQDICDSLKSVNDKLNSLVRKIDALEDKVRLSQPKTSCEEVKASVPSSPSGYYSILVNGNRLRTVYCNMDLVCARGDTKGWMRVGYLDMRGSRRCPPGMRMFEKNGKRGCGRRASMNTAGCESVTLPTNGFKYTQVCGRVTGYQIGSPDALAVHSVGERGNIDKAYLDGVSITRGSGPRKHVWSYLASLAENLRWCPCDQNRAIPSPSFIGNDYFCETGVASRWDLTTFHTNDLLWDGQQCGSIQAACCTRSRNMPWFKKSVGAATADNLELRVCGDQGVNDENVAVNYYEIYVK